MRVFMGSHNVITNVKKLYRYEGYHNKVNLCTFNVVKETKCGYWIDTSPPKWVGKNTFRSFAYPDVNKARINYLRRSEKYIKILKLRLEDTKTRLDVCKNMHITEAKNVFIEDKNITANEFDNYHTILSCYCHTKDCMGLLIFSELENKNYHVTLDNKVQEI